MAATSAHHERLRTLDPYEFELFIAELWSRRGWETEVSQRSVDRGIDVIATRSNPFREKQVIQAKRYGEGNNVGSSEIQQYSSLRHQENGVDTVVVVTTSGFTTQAEELAGDLNVKLLDGESLSAVVERTKATDLVEKYASAVTESSAPSSSSTSQETSSVDTDSKEMGTGEAIISVIQLLLIAGLLIYAIFELLTNLL
ncbi:restriction endonuclease [Halegenticoccus tardaugens]|uniref:restriction endonuclease n=1 Tax=Halegenticoccus tardaugens TaxID=2071624 RepID=UPI00100B0455|nr:restriction endonuclease [Halegenticoccus tardaugens]